MIVCVCHRVSERDIHREVRSGCGTFDLLQDELRVGTGCGACTECARETFEGACQAAGHHDAALRAPVPGPSLARAA